MSTDVLAPLLEAAAPVAGAVATLQLVRSPIRAADGSLRMHRQDVRAGQTVADVLPPQHTWVRVIWNGRVLTPAECQTHVVAVGDELTAFPTWGIPALAVPWIITLVVGLVISAAATALSYVLFPPKKPHAIEPAIDEPTASFEGIRTTVGPGQVVAVAYGSPRLGGQLLSAKVEQALTVIDAPMPEAGVGQFPIAEVVGGTLSDYGAPQELIVVTVFNHGTVTGAQVDISGVQGKTNTNRSWFVRVLDAHRLELLGSIGVDPRPYEGGGVLILIDQDARGSRRVDAITTPPTLTMLLSLGEGPIEGILWGTLEINGQPLGNFPTAQAFVRLGTSDQTPMPEFGETANTFADGREITSDPGITYTTTRDVQGFVLNIAFQQGLYFLSKTGEKQENVSTIGYRYRVSPAGAWTGYSFFAVAAARTSVVRFGVRREGLPLETYDINVIWTHAFHTEDGQSAWQGTLDSVTEIQVNTNAYPNTVLLGLRSIATDALQGALPNITVQVLGRAVRVNTFAPTLTYTDNPAWCVMDLLTNTRYGMKIPDFEIDLPGFAAWAAYCDESIGGEKRHTLNYVLDREQRAQAAVLEIAGGSRTILFKSEGVWTPRPTRNTLPVQLLSWANVSNVSLTYTKDPDEINVLEARFSNEEQQFEQDVLTWPIIGDWPVTVRKASLDLRGVTKPSRVMRTLQFELNRRRFELLSLECDCALDAMVLQPHDIFRFAHPLPGWGTSGRVRAGSTFETIVLDTPVTFQAGLTYHLYLRFANDATDVKPVVNPGGGTYTSITMAVPFGTVPEPGMTLWAFGEDAPVDKAIKLFRVVRLQRKSDNTVHLQAIAHNPSIYDEPVAVPLPVITSLFNPLGIPPPLVSLVATEVVRVQPSGASLRAVDLSWDVAALSAGFAPYGGAAIFRRSVVLSGQLGQVQTGTLDLGVIQDPNDPNVNFAPLANVRGHVLDFDDYTIQQGATYLYRVVPISGRGVPNHNGGREALIHITGPTTSGFFPGTVRNLRLKGQSPSDTNFEGRDIYLEWDPIVDSPLFSTTFFVQSYTVEVWAPDQLYLLRRTSVPAAAPGQSLTFVYNFQQNLEDQLLAGFSAARRDVLFLVFAVTNTNQASLSPATLEVHNPPPDMGDMAPVVTVIFEGALLAFDQFVEPRDFDHYEIFLDTVTPPLTIYESISTAFSGVGQAFRHPVLLGLTHSITYYVYVLPYDTFGPGIPTGIVSFVPAALSAESLDTVPPGIPTGLTLTTGSDLSDDGTIMPWVRASWNRAPESDVAGYEVHVFVGTSIVPTVYNPTREQFSIQFPVPGNLVIRVKLLAFDRTHNISPFTAEASITAGGDTTLPGLPTGMNVFGSFRAVVINWIPPADLDYDVTEVWAAFSQNVSLAFRVGVGLHTFVHEGLGTGQTLFYWLRARDTSGNVSAFTPGPTSGMGTTTVTTSSADIGNLSITETKISDNSISTPKLQANAVTANKVTTGELITLGAQIRDAIITTGHVHSLSASKLIAGTIQALVQIGVGNNIFLDGPGAQIYISDQQVPPRTRVLMGKLGGLSTQWGLRLFGPNGELMWNFATGATTDGISDASITAPKISAGIIEASHLRADTALITNFIQIATGIINTAHIGNGQIQYANIGSAQVLRGHIQDAAIDSAKIDSMVADKITTGTLNAHVSVGVGNTITIDGFNHLITVKDNLGAVRVYLGLVFGNYGLQVWSAAGELMWDFTDGARTEGIAPAAVTTPKITTNAVTSSLMHAVGGSIVIAASSFEVIAATLTFPALLPNDTVQLIGSMGIFTQNGNFMTIRIRENGVSGPILASRSTGVPGDGGGTSMAALHAVYPVGSVLASKVFVLTIQISASTGRVDELTFTGLRLQR